MEFSLFLRDFNDKSLTVTTPATKQVTVFTAHVIIASLVEKMF